eukprot:3248826-Lingulodinium_polyedra.AAC.1
MKLVADELEKLGFDVPDRQPAAVGDKKLVGYQLRQGPARLVLPAQKAATLAAALYWLVEGDV